MLSSLRSAGLWLLCLSLSCGLVNSAPDASADDAYASPLWQPGGTDRDAAGRLPDYSYAGYHRGECSLPERQPDVSVRDYGAVGDGTTDDTRAFQRALRESRGHVIAVPAGRYLITDILEIVDSGTVLQGAGPDKSVLYVPTPLEQIRSNMGETTSGRPTSNYSWSGGIVWARGRWSERLLARVTRPALRGERSLQVDTVSSFHVGDEARLVMQDSQDKTLTAHLYAGDPGNTDELRSVREEWIARIIAIDPERQRIVFDRALRTDVRLPWRPMLYPARSSVEEVGIENLGFEFPVTPYQGHFTELGYNAIAFSGVRNGWIRNIEIHHADSGLFLSGANNTVRRITWHSDRRRDTARNSTGHHGITLGGTDQLLRDFDFRTKFIHDITMSRGSAGNVVCCGRAEDLTFDHHKYANHANLFTDIDAGVGTDIFRSGGGADLGRHCGAWTTWWNIRTERAVHFPAGWATDVINIVGVRSDDPAVTDWDGRWFEPVAPQRLQPVNLYDAQLQRRLDDR